MGERDIDPRPPWTGADGEAKAQLATVSFPAQSSHLSMLMSAPVLEAADGSQAGVQIARLCRSHVVRKRWVPE